MGNINTYRIVVEKSLDKYPFGRLKGILENTISKGLKGVGSVVGKTQIESCLTSGCSSGSATTLHKLLPQ